MPLPVPIHLVDWAGSGVTGSPPRFGHAAAAASMAGISEQSPDPVTSRIGRP